MSSYDPRLYEVLHRGTPGDLSYYRELTAKAARVLELGCGYGRVLAALAESPRSRLVGIDLHSGLLDRAREHLGERAEVIAADMTDFEVGFEGFDAVLIPYSGLWCLPSREAMGACLACALRHLAPGGVLGFDAYCGDGWHEDPDPAPETTGPVLVTEVEVGRLVYEVYETSVWHPERQAFSVAYRYEPIGDGPVESGRIEHHYLRIEQLVGLLVEVGFSAVAMQDGFQGGEVTLEAEHLVVRARKAP